MQAVTVTMMMSGLEIQTKIIHQLMSAMTKPLTLIWNLMVSELCSSFGIIYTGNMMLSFCLFVWGKVFAGEE